MKVRRDVAVDHPRGGRTIRRGAIALVVTLAGISGGTLAPSATAARSRLTGGADLVVVWNETASDAMVASGISPTLDPLHESRLYAMMHLAIHDALNAIERRSRPYALDIGVLPGASPQAAVITAAHDVLVPGLQQLPAEFAGGIPAAVDMVESAAAEDLAAVPYGEAKQAGIQLGRAAAAVINALRIGDGADGAFLDFDYPQLPGAGQFRFVEGAPFAVFPTWGEVTPFAMRSGDQFRPRPPYDVTSRRYADDLNEVKELGSITSTTRTAEQTEIAFFWFENSPMRWNRIARTVSQSAGLDMWDSARLFGLLNIAEADGYIGNWEAKHFYNFWRPETAVRLADTDGNPRTVADPTWTSLWGSSGATPEYDSGHTIEGAGAATVLADVFGTDDVTFSICSVTFKDTPENNCDGTSPIYREYHSFSAAAHENGVSRIYIGWHFRHSVDVGYRHGDQIGRLTVNRFLRPVH